MDIEKLNVSVENNAEKTIEEGDTSPWKVAQKNLEFRISQRFQHAKYFEDNIRYYVIWLPFEQIWY